MGLGDGQRGHFGILGLQSSMSQGFSKEGEALLTAWKNPAPPTKRGSNRRIEMKVFKPFLNISFKITYLFLVVNKKNKVFERNT